MFSLLGEGDLGFRCPVAAAKKGDVLDIVLSAGESKGGLFDGLEMLSARIQGPEERCSDTAERTGDVAREERLLWRPSRWPSAYTKVDDFLTSTFLGARSVLGKSLAWKKRLSMLRLIGAGSKSKRLGEFTSGGERPLLPPKSLTMLLGRPVCGLVKPSALMLPPRSSLECARASELVGRGRLDGSSVCVGVDWLLSTLDFLAKDRGVTLPTEKTFLPGEPSRCTLGVSFEGSGRAVGVVFETVDLVVGVEVPAMRGVSGVRTARVDAIVGRVGRGGRAVSLPRSDMSHWRYRGRDMEMLVVARRRGESILCRSDCYDLTSAANAGSVVA